MSLTLEQLTSIETAMHSQRPTDRRRIMEEYLHSDFREFGLSGTTYDKAAILRDAGEAPGRRPIIWSQDFHCLELSDNLSLLTYRSAHIGKDDQLERHALRSSLWRRDRDGWRLLFHQGTPALPFEKS